MAPQESATPYAATEWSLNSPLKVADPEVHAIIVKEKERQRLGLEMIASENLTSLPVLECMGSCLHNKYSEGQPGQRLPLLFSLFLCSFALSQVLWGQ